MPKRPARKAPDSLSEVRIVADFNRQKLTRRATDAQEFRWYDPRRRDGQVGAEGVQFRENARRCLGETKNQRDMPEAGTTRICAS